ncbi:hypothetical protein N9C66_09705 [Akkermansiaceae bacterium]|nr:hypothetical protein [Akkermansiaceae bacterium]
MKSITLLILALSTSLGFANKELITKLDELFDLRIKVNKEYKERFTEEARDLENAEARKFLVKSENDYGQKWIDHLEHMKTSPDIKARLLVLHLEIVGDLNNGYYELEGASGLVEKAKAKTAITKWKKALKKLEEAEALYKAMPKKRKE